MEDVEIPHHFICPISLQIMKDPVTVATGITYDRDSIQRWQSQNQNHNTCPVTNQPLPNDAIFTPNHNLRRLIQSWSHASSEQQVPTKDSYVEMKVIVTNLIKNLNQPGLKMEALICLENIASEGDKTKVSLKEFGVVKAMFRLVVSCYRNCTIVGLKEALNILYLVRLTQDEACAILVKYDRIISALAWVLDLDDACDDSGKITSMKLHAMVLLKDIIQEANSLVLERLDRDFFKTMVLIIRHRKSNSLNNGIKEILHVMETTCAWPRNCSMMIDLGVVFELIELEFGSPEKAITEMIMGVLFHLCSSADGRAQLLGHAAGIALITKRLSKVSRKVDERALMIISLITRFSGTDGVLKEMARVGTVEKLCTVLQVYGIHSFPWEKAREILKRHSNVWKNSPCLDGTLLTIYPS